MPSMDHIWMVSHVIAHEGERIISLHHTYSGAWRAARRCIATRPHLTISGPGGTVYRMPSIRGISRWLEMGVSIFQQTDFIAIDKIDVYN